MSTGGPREAATTTTIFKLMSEFPFALIVQCVDHRDMDHVKKKKILLNYKLLFDGVEKLHALGRCPVGSAKD